MKKGKNTILIIREEENFSKWEYFDFLGEEFTRPVNKNHLAKNLSDIVMHYHYHQNHPLGWIIMFSY